MIYFISLLHADTKKDIVEKINILHTQHINNALKKESIECLLTSEEKKSVKLQYPQSIYEYYNMLLETNHSNAEPSRFIQNLLVDATRDKNTLATLLGLQLYFIKQCEKCEQIYNANMNYYRKYNPTLHDILATEGGSYAQSYVLQGEAFLCNALKHNNPNDFLLAYANLMMSGNHTRAINALLAGIAVSNDNVLLETFKFLGSHDIVFVKNPYGIYLLKRLALQNKANNFDIITSLHHFQNLKVLENNLTSNHITQMLLIRDMDIGRILSPFHKLATRETIAQYYDKQRHYEEMLHKNDVIIFDTATIQELKEYYRILTLKDRLRQVKYYPYATTYNYKQ